LSARVAQLYIYPVKSCAGLALQESLLTDTGLEFDRAWMVVDAQGNFVTQREAPQLALVTPQFKGDQLVLRAPGMLALYLNLYEYEGNTRVTVWDDSLPAFDMGDLAAQWFTDFLAQFESKVSTPAAYRLARFDPEQQRLSSLQWTAGVQAPNQFSDGYPLLLVSQASLDGLNARLLAGGHEAVGMARFRLTKTGWPCCGWRLGWTVKPPRCSSSPSSPARAAPSPILTRLQPRAARPWATPCRPTGKMRVSTAASPLA
jgi:uncharacterized protein YcbX